MGLKKNTAGWWEIVIHIFTDFRCNQFLEVSIGMLDAAITVCDQYGAW
ncbi:hypothetical protein CF149_02564 [Pseudomonas psychrophila]|nr:hypothetical protein CF149_02564 [Pseudomonas psychrophila]